MAILYREMKMTSDLQSFEEPDSIKGEMQLVEREDGAYVIWLEKQLADALNELSKESGDE